MTQTSLEVDGLNRSRVSAYNIRV